MRLWSTILILTAGIASAAPAETKIEDLMHQAWKEVEAAPKGASADVAIRWAERLWQYREKAGHGPDVAKATAGALHLLASSNNHDQLKTRADSVPPDDDAWRDGIRALFGAAVKHQDYGYLIRTAQAVMNSTASSKTKAAVALTLGDGYWRDGDLEKAKQSFQLALLHGNGDEVAARAQGNLYEMAALSTGSPAPPVEASTLGGERFRTEQFRDKVVLWSFWATWCSACRADIPKLKQLDSEFRERGLVIVTVALDEDVDVLRRFVHEQKLSWPQIQDGKGGPLANLFNVTGPPTKWLVDRQGRIVGKQLEGEKLRMAIEAALNTDGGSPTSSDAKRERSHRLKEVFDALGVKAGARVADIGAGSGFVALRLGRAVGPQGRVWAVDVDDKQAIPQLKKAVRTEALSNVEVVLGLADDPRLPAGGLDAVLMMNAYHEMVSHGTMLTRVAESLKPGGRLVIVDNMPRKIRSGLRADQAKNHVLAPELAEQELRSAGFVVVRRQDDFSSPDPDTEELRWMIVAERPVVVVQTP